MANSLIPQFLNLLRSSYFNHLCAKSPTRLAHNKLAQVTALIRSAFLGSALIIPYWHMACIYLGLACWAES